ncbi:hypothetical protein BCV70DRAFT_145949, partial [Testicularia cyperi]
CTFLVDHEAGPTCSSKRTSRSDHRNSFSSSYEEGIDSLTPQTQPFSPTTTNKLSSDLPFGLISTLSSSTNTRNLSPTAPNKLSYTLPSWLTPLSLQSPSSAPTHNQQASQPSPTSSTLPSRPFLNGAHLPTHDSPPSQSSSFLNNLPSHQQQPTSISTSDVRSSSSQASNNAFLRAPLAAAISNPASPTAQANLLRQLQSVLASIRPAQAQSANTASAASLTSAQAPVSHIQQAFAQAQPASAPAFNRRHTVASSQQQHRQRPSSSTQFSSITPAQKQRIEQIRFYQRLIAQLRSTMPSSSATDAGVQALPLGALSFLDADKIDAGLNASFGLNPMSADDPSWIGHGFQAQAAEDFLSSPDWTDPSPALTDSMSFELDSCGPSPLLPLDSYEEDFGVPGIAGAPLFPRNDGYASSNVSPFEAAQSDFAATATTGDFGSVDAGSNFSLFPDDAAAAAAIANKTGKGPAEMAFSKLGKATGNDSPAMTLLRALSSAALSNASVAATVATTTAAAPAVAAPALTASPLAFTSMAAPAMPTAIPIATVAEPAQVIEEQLAAAADDYDRSRSSSPSLSRRSSSSKSESRGTKRRLESADLLPLDAPIQKRNYYTVSATSRRDTVAEVDAFAAEEDAIRREKDPRVAKRLSNTLAARRSRHRKAEELRLLHEKIDALTSEVETWKKRCELAEKERDEARA